MPKIMLVDDERRVLSSLRRSIHVMPADTFEDETIVEVFEQPRLALVRAAECEFDIVISDWRMPVMSGIAFLGELIAIQPNIARLVLSGYGEFLPEMDAINRVKIFHFLGKPWNNEELRTLLIQALQHRRQRLAQGQSSSADQRPEGSWSDAAVPGIALRRSPANSVDHGFAIAQPFAPRS